MHSHYVEIACSKSGEITCSQVIGEAFHCAHIAISESEDRGVGVSFPEIGKSGVGSKLRIFGSEASLCRVLEHPALSRINGYAKVSAIVAVPARSKHRVIRRLREKAVNAYTPAHIARLARRNAKRGTQPGNQKQVQHASTKPAYILARSHSNGQRYSIFLDVGPIIDTPTSGVFNSYGLSHEATTPWF